MILLCWPCYLAAKLLQKSIENQSKIKWKMLHIFISILIDFWSILEAKLAPKPNKNRSQIHKTSHPTSDWFFDRFLIDLGTQLSPQIPLWSPTWSPGGANWDSTWNNLGTNGTNLTVQINSFDKRSEKKEYRIGNGMFKDWKWNVRTQNSFERLEWCKERR